MYGDTNGPYPGSSSSKSQSDYCPFSEDPASPLNPDFYPLTDRFNGPSTAPATVLDNANSNPDLCSDLPINRLANRTILIFKGHFFWTMDPRTKALCPARNVMEEFGIPSPIDSAITRTNCQGKSYIIKIL
ncbi:proteoglycan 4-like [Oncorhynchus tshawytscha]|uniref:proteoglycan 4-like n=1 Tax=Oncorhynchus tshawytscha TaxID=74940 RepID=UPI000D0A51AA|nr:proteoglycan 4-like [Oncorhynchus tshawytscha]